jgi:PTH1 family peptidyl-tRNA hydrolase
VKVIIGLGNPGRDYVQTRHNIGFFVIDELAARAGVSFRRSWWSPVERASCTIGQEVVSLVKPQTFMNRSGLAAGPALRKAGGKTDDLMMWRLVGVNCACGLRARRADTTECSR